MTNLIRKEFFGNLIWSNKRRKYYIAQNLKAERAINRLLSEDIHRELIDDDILKNEILELFDVEQPFRVLDPNYGLRLSAPLEIYFDFTWLCNLSKTCGQAYCYAKNVLGNTTMTVNQIEDIIKRIYEWGVMRIHIAGGEPTSRKKELDACLKATNKYGIETSITTNGTIIDREITRILLSNNLYSITFSLDGYDENTNSVIRGKGNFQKTIDAITSIVSQKAKLSLNTKICLKPTFPPNVSKEWFETFIKLAIDLKVDSLKLNNPERCLFHEKGYYGKIVDSYYEDLFYIKYLQDKYKQNIDISIPNNPLLGCPDIGIPGSSGCIGGQELLYIGANGSLNPCAIHNYNFGNINHFDSFDNFWRNSEKLNVFRSQLTSAHECKTCDIHNQCRGGSVTRKIVEKGIFEKEKDPLCPTAYLTKHNKPKPQKVKNNDWLNFKEIVVAHSL